MASLFVTLRLFNSEFILPNLGKVLKRPVIFSLAFLTVMILSVFPSYAQHQRLGVGPQEIILSGETSSACVQAFCFDRHLKIDKGYDYRFLQSDESAIQVTVGSDSYTLSQAIEQNKIKVTGKPGPPPGARQLIEITKLVPETVSIKISKTSVFRDTPGTYHNQQALDALNSLKPSLYSMQVDSRAIQDLVWTADIDRSRLESLGYESIEEFHEKHNLRRTHGTVFDPQTSAKLEAEEKALTKRFEDTGLEFRDFETQVQSVSDNIRLFEQQSKITETGIFSSETRRLFEEFEPEAKFDYANTSELYLFGEHSGLDVCRVISSLGDKNLYTLYNEFEKLYVGNNVAEINSLLSIIAERLKVDNKKLYLDLDFPSAEKARDFKTSFNISNLIFIEAKPEATRSYFLLLEPVEILSTTTPTLRNGEWSTSINLNANRKITATAKNKSVLLKFVGEFKKLIGVDRSLAFIVHMSRAASGDLKVSFTDRFGNNHLVKLFRHENSDVNAGYVCRLICKASDLPTVC